MKEKIVTVTGYQGFVGSALLSWPKIPGLHVEPMSNQTGPINMHSISEVYAYLNQRKPDIIIHLAAQSNVPRSFEIPNETYLDNFHGVSSILSALAKSHLKSKFILASSAHAYGNTLEKDQPIKETHTLAPVSPYGLSKFCAEELLKMDSKSKGFEAIFVRPFNITGPGQSDQFVLSALAKQIVEVSLGKRAFIEAGNLDVYRDFLDVRDAASAFLQLSLEDPQPGAYNLCSGQAHRLKDLLQKMMTLANVKVPTIADKARLRPSDQKVMVGCNEKLKKETRWQPRISIEQTLTDLINYWRNQLCQKSAR